MKKAGAVISLLIILVVLSTSLSFASGLTLVSSFPEEGDNGLQPANIAVKLVFSENMTSDAAQNSNSNRFTITDQEGKKINFDPLYNAEKYPNEIWLQITETLTDNMEYTVKISGDLESSAGNSLDAPLILKFATRDTAADNNGYMVLMVIMVLGMVVFTAWDTKRQLKKADTNKDEEEKVNPYKEAKKTGKSVEEVVAKTEKEKAKTGKKKAKPEADDKESAPKATEEVRDGVKKVKVRRAIAEAGVATPSQIVERKRKQEEEKLRKAAEKEERGRQKSKGSKQQQRKKK